ncbi:MAG: response regulator [Nitrincola lacisaponensis]|uniref:Transcriptional regulator, LuxR family n=1 Tax=Nitrincola lacisaponensis TaxID=267850 RepID=A0A063Y674_9GAMM|nr:response regulator transcription factor [Nitrincola lacisaponensis]KDE40256.1 Transcriptional regulator, LuxR family [Nitrincola lacisaponensis]
MHTLLIADDHPLFREALMHVIDTALTAPEILEAGTLDDTLTLATAHEEIDLILLDINMPGMHGLEGLSRLRQQAPTIPVVIISAEEDKQTVLRALDQGAAGFIAKSSAREEMTSALQQILEGEVYLPASIMRQSPALVHSKPKPQLSPDLLFSLTRKQLLVLERMVQGDSNKQIAAHLNIAETTVKAHVSAILSKLGVHNRVQAILAASELDFSTLTRR